VKALCLDGASIEFEADGLLARAVQHELDHTHGILYIDRAIPEDRMDFADDIQRLVRPIV
jgi:peptide deformylase